MRMKLLTLTFLENSSRRNDEIDEDVEGKLVGELNVKQFILQSTTLC